MIHLLKAGSKPIGKEYKRRIVPIASTLADFQQEQQQFQMQANERAQASKRKAPQQSRGQSNDEAANAKDANQKAAANMSKVKPVGEPLPNPLSGPNEIKNQH